MSDSPNKHESDKTKRSAPRVRLVTLGATIALGLGGVAAYAAATGTQAARVPAIQRMKATPPGPWRLVRAEGLNPAAATTVFRLRNGQSVSVASNSRARCLLRRGATGGSETCGTYAEIDEGAAISVLDECGSSGANLMEVTGLAPADAAEVRLVRTDETSESSPVKQGAFRFDGTNPVSGGAYPRELAWLGPEGAQLGAARLPVKGDEFCITPPDPPSEP